MRKHLIIVQKHRIVATSLMALFLCVPQLANAQSGSKETASSTKAATVGLEGYCPVCILDMKKWVRGNPEIKSTFDGKTYLFPGQEQKATFDANPAKYAPVLGGDCVVAYKKMNKRIPGQVGQGAFHGGRLYLFVDENAKNEFLAHREMYANADLALDGKCTVCKIEMQKDVDGDLEIGVMYNGLRYLFPGTEQRDMFIADPSKYAVGTADRQTGAAGGSSKK